MLGFACWMALVGVAVADEGAADDAPGIEITVTESVNVTEAREALDGALAAEGYLPGVSVGARTIYLHPQPWQPHVVVFDSGFARVHGHMVTPMGLVGAWLPRNHPGVEVVGVWADPRTVRGMEARVFEALRPSLDDWRDAMAEEALVLRQEQLRAQVRAIWERGEGPDGATLATPEARRLALGALWLETADNAAGAEVRALLMAFIDQRVQRSGAPFTEAEVAAINAARGFEAAFWPRPP